MCFMLFLQKLDGIGCHSVFLTRSRYLIAIHSSKIISRHVHDYFKVNVLSYKQVFVPINRGGSHWISVIKQELEYFDSIGGEYTSGLKKSGEYV